MYATEFKIMKYEYLWFITHLYKKKMMNLDDFKKFQYSTIEGVEELDINRVSSYNENRSEHQVTNWQLTIIWNSNFEHAHGLNH